MEYRENVHSADALRVAVWCAALLAFAGAGWSFVVGEETARWLTMTLLLGGAAALAVVGWWFLTLHIEVTPEAVSFHFGPFGRRFAPGHVERIAVKPYRWIVYGGWGIRMAPGKRRAYTVPFVRTGVELTASDGKAYYVSSRNPQLLAAAIETAGNR